MVECDINTELYEALQELLQGNEVYHSNKETGYTVAPSPHAVAKGIKAIAKAEGGKTTYQITQELRKEMREG